MAGKYCAPKKTAVKKAPVKKSGKTGKAKKARY